MGELGQLNIAHNRLLVKVIVVTQKGRCPIVEGSFARLPGGKGERQGVRADLEVSVWFSNSGKGGKRPGLGRERAWKEDTVTGGGFCEILRY